MKIDSGGRFSTFTDIIYLKSFQLKCIFSRMINLTHGDCIEKMEGIELDVEYFNIPQQRINK